MQTSYRWLILALVVVTAATVAAAPVMALSVLFKEIATELHMNLVQVGLIGTVSSMMMIAVSLAGGALSDRLGPRRTIVVACILTGGTGAARAFATSFETLVVTTVMFGLALPLVNIAQTQLCATWFAPRELGTANGLLSVGMALGFLLGALLSATVFSPVLGGWRSVLAGYGALALLMALVWMLIRDAPDRGQERRRISLRAGFGEIARQRNMWVLGIAGLGYGGAVGATLLYLPLYLRNIGWSGADADSTVAAFHLVSMLGAVPIAMLSDRLGKRRVFLLAGSLLMAGSVGGLTLAAGNLIVLAVLAGGLMRDAFMAVFMTTTLEVRGVGAGMAGSAVGFMLIFFGIGSVVSPPLGNSLATFGPAVPFAFWGAMAAVGFLALLLLDTSALQRHR